MASKLKKGLKSVYVGITGQENRQIHGCIALSSTQDASVIT